MVGTRFNYRVVVFATGNLAVVPPLFKGIELFIVNPKTKVKMYLTLTLIGNQYGVYERWFMGCYPPVGITEALGPIVVPGAIWVTMENSYCEFRVLKVASISIWSIGHDCSHHFKCF